MARSTFEGESLWRSPALWALVLFELTLVAPIGAYLLWRFPDWSVMYWGHPEGMLRSSWVLVLLYPMFGVSGLLVTRLLLLRQRVLYGALVAALGIVVAAVLVWLKRKSLTMVGSTVAFRLDPESLRPIVDTPLPYLLPAAGLALVVSFAATVWRLRLMVMAEGIRRRAERQKEAAVLKPGAKTLPPRKVQAKRKTAQS